LLSEKSISISTKAIIKAVRLSGHSVRGHDPYDSVVIDLFILVL